MGEFAPGQIVFVDWRDALPREANKFRPAVVVEDADLFVTDHPNVVLVPLSGDAKVVMPDLSVTVEPTPENGCTARCYALANHVTTASKRRIRPTSSRITAEQLQTIRERIAITIGLGRHAVSD